MGHKQSWEEYNKEYPDVIMFEQGKPTQLWNTISDCKLVLDYQPLETLNLRFLQFDVKERTKNLFLVLVKIQQSRVWTDSRNSERGEINCVILGAWIDVTKQLVITKATEQIKEHPLFAEFKRALVSYCEYLEAKLKYEDRPMWDEIQKCIQELPQEIRKHLLVPNFLNHIFNLENAETIKHVDSGDSMTYYTHVYCLMSENGGGGDLELCDAKVRVPLRNGDCARGLFAVYTHENHPIDLGTRRFAYILALQEGMVQKKFRITKQNIDPNGKGLLGNHVIHLSDRFSSEERNQLVKLIMEHSGTTPLPSRAKTYRKNDKYKRIAIVPNNVEKIDAQLWQKCKKNKVPMLKASFIHTIDTSKNVPAYRDHSVWLPTTSGVQTILFSKR